MPTRALAGHHCIITGASRGIGAAIAHRFAADGARCTLIGRNHGSLKELSESLPSPHDFTQHRVVVGDVAKREFWEGLPREERDADILVNAAGVTHYSLLMATRPELVEEVIGTNLMGAIWSCQVIVKNMMRRKTGCIVNISSLLGIKGGRGSTAYAASKAGIIGLTRSLAAEVGPMNIRVNAILPGYIQTQMTEAMTSEARSKVLDQIPLKRFGKAEEVADAAMFLARNKYASNCVLNLDGGLSAA